MPLLERNIGADERRWTTALVNLMGPNRLLIGELRGGSWRDANWNNSADHGYSIAMAILKRLAGAPGSDRLIIDALIARASFAPECARVLAAEYASDEYFPSSLRVALSSHQAGVIYVAWNLIDNGQRSFLPYALKSAREIADAPAQTNLTHANMLDRDAAASLLRQQSGGMWVFG